MQSKDTGLLIKQFDSNLLRTAMLGLFFLISCLSGCIYEAEATMSEAEVKSAVEAIAETWICSDESLSR